MPRIQLPDGKELAFDESVDGFAVAKSVGAKKPIALEVDGEIRDLARPVPDDAAVRVVTADDRDPDALYVLRHSCAHVLAEAICKLFPGTELAYGPPTDEGFFYDLRTPEPLSADDFAKIEKEMKRIVKADRRFVRREYDPDEGLARTAGDKYKRDNAERALERGSEVISFYSTGQPGEDWEDLCAGPHVPSTRFLKNFKVLSVAGAYWKGDQSSDRLTRVYGTCFADRESLDGHLRRLEEAKKRDHRRIGKEMELFHFMDDNPGQVLWHPKGWTIYRSLTDYIRDKLTARGYVEVNTPTLMPKSLWERSGHWSKFHDNMFLSQEEDRGEGDGEATTRLYALKPMNCPGHIDIFKQRVRSYRELPLRMAEFGSCVRYEPSGALHGIMRVRGFVQDDAHIFCTEDQIGEEVAAFCELTKEVYRELGFGEGVSIKFSTRPELRVGSDAEWDRAEAALEDACRGAGLRYEINPGEGAFYGPKLEFVLTDCLGRDWQCGTIQVDFQLASKARLDATYVGADGDRHHLVILHRAVLGSLERFIGILIEHFAGKFPLWLAPEQIRVLPVTDEHLPYGREICERLRAAGLRANVDTDAHKLGAKIRLARNDRVNYFAVVGEREAETGTVALQRQDGSKCGEPTVDDLVAMLRDEVASRALPEEG